MRINGDMVKIQIQPNKLRILYQRRPCGDLLNIACQEPDPPHADFPNGWGGFADTTHVDFKIPSEHLINGQRYDAEMQVYNLHPDRERMAAHAQVITAEPNSHNWYFEQALLAFEFEYERDLAICAASVRRDRQLVTDMHVVLGSNGNNVTTTSQFVDYETWAQYSTIMDHPRYEQYSEEMKTHRHLQNVGFDPLNPMLVPSIHFYRYEGSITEPPCGEFVSWFVTDVPMIISTDQLVRLKTYLFNHVNTMCMRTSVHHAESVARPIQEIAGRPVHLCTSRDFGPDDPNRA
jgi:Eukaryotic-type carbonic anhydrase